MVNRAKIPTARHANAVQCHRLPSKKPRLLENRSNIMVVKLKTGPPVGTLSLMPLLDIIFLLLIFFLVATRFAEEDREMEMPLPDTSISGAGCIPVPWMSKL